VLFTNKKVPNFVDEVFGAHWLRHGRCALTPQVSISRNNHYVPNEQTLGISIIMVRQLQNHEI
jgi:hypothetical protein